MHSEAHFSYVVDTGQENQVNCVGGMPSPRNMGRRLKIIIIQFDIMILSPISDNKVNLIVWPDLSFEYGAPVYKKHLASMHTVVHVM